MSDPRELPILMSGSLVRATLGERKTETRRCADGSTCLSAGCGHQRRHGPGRIVTFGWYPGGPQQTILVEDGER